MAAVRPLTSLSGVISGTVENTATSVGPIAAPRTARMRTIPSGRDGRDISSVASTVTAPKSTHRFQGRRGRAPAVITAAAPAVRPRAANWAPIVSMASTEAVK